MATVCAPLVHRRAREARCAGLRAREHTTREVQVAAVVEVWLTLLVMSVAKRITVHEAKTQLSKLIERAIRGEDITIHRGTEPVVRLVPIRKAEPRRKFGAMKHKIRVPDSFFDPLPEDELAAWE